MINNLINYLLNNFQVFAPTRNGQEFFIKEINKPTEIDWSGRMTSNSWKNIFLPPSELLFNFHHNKIVYAKNKPSNIVALGMNVLDLQALGLFELVFAKDKYFQDRRKNILVIGLSVGAPSEFKDWQVFSHNLEENILEHLPFDIFLEKQTNNQFKIYYATDKGGQILEKNKIKDFQHIQFSGLIKEEGPDQKMLRVMEKIKVARNNKVWAELGKICLACGKCSIVCPTCFCYDIYDQSIGLDDFQRKRTWSNCFYPEFSQISDNNIFLNSVSKKIRFWYEHKFWRIPHEYKVPGCVSCLRCNKVCPVGIKIEKTISAL